jgi:hypothetical protein
VKLFLILAALAVLWLPARLFEMFAAWEARLWTALENEQAGRKGGGR